MYISKDIARLGRYSLRRPSFITDHIYNTHELEIVEWKEENTKVEYCFTIASFNENGEIVSCGNRLLNSVETEKDMDAIKILSNIAYTIIATTDKLDYKE